MGWAGLVWLVIACNRFLLVTQRLRSRIHYGVVV